MAWVGMGPRDHPLPPPAMGRDVFHYPRLLQAPSILAPDPSGMGQPQFLWETGARASPPASSSPSPRGAFHPQPGLILGITSPQVQLQLLGLFKPQRTPWPPCPTVFDDTSQINPSTGIKKANTWSRVVLQHRHPAVRPLPRAMAL